MKKLLLALVIVFAMSVPAFADSSADASATAFTVISTSETSIVNDPRELPGAIPVFPQAIPLISGKVGDVTSQVVKFAIAAKPYGGELVVKVLKVVNGSIFDRVRLEDIEQDFLSAWEKVSQMGDPKKIRYLVQYKESTNGSGFNLGGAGAVSGLNGGSTAYGGTGSVGTGFGYVQSTTDPKYIIKFFLIQ